VLNETLKKITFKIEDVDNPVTHSCDIVVLERILHGISSDLLT
jgi:hypothetical protein